MLPRIITLEGKKAAGPSPLHVMLVSYPYLTWCESLEKVGVSKGYLL